mmetsp:Transcript_27429/g.40554  ORF Transcript_27429/g.40554 Transcript_27429/m.40554 type:complete len:230 (-) Transcript_27429:261-950(-)
MERKSALLVANTLIDAGLREKQSPWLLKREPLRFEFCGYSIWLEIEEKNNDVSNAINQFAQDLGVLPIPQAHVTALYGMDHIDEDEARYRFINYVTPDKFSSWPPLKPVGIAVDVEYAGVNGGTMDMAWSEITMATSSAHEEYLDILHNIFYGPKSLHGEDRHKPWMPHLSLAYDNPDNSVVTLDHTTDLLAQNPSLLQRAHRKVTGISLWRTRGKMTEWEKLEDISLI